MNETAESYHEALPFIRTERREIWIVFSLKLKSSDSFHTRKIVINTFSYTGLLSYLCKDRHNTCIGITNKRPMGHIAHLRNQFKSIKTHTITKHWLEEQEAHGPHRSPQWETSSNQWIHLSKVMINIFYIIGLVVQKEKIFKFREYTFAILLLSPNVKRSGLSIWTENPLYPGMLFAKFCWNWPSESIESFLIVYLSLSPLGKMRGPSLK